MTSLPADPIAPGGLDLFARRLRRREISAAEATSNYLHRIRVLEPKLNAFEWVDAEGALATARAVDALLAANTDLGPLMGVPVAIKDVLAVQGMPTTAGSYLDVSDMIGPEGRFVRRLRRAGCVILGKTKTVEFALGAARHARGSPRNPCDATVHRSPGGSSSGSAVAVAAGLCGFAVGTDTGGSVRIPAAFCGVFGLKTSAGRWPTDGVFPAAPSFDTIGLLTATAADAALVYSTLEDTPPPAPAEIRSLRLGRPARPFFEDIDSEVASCMERALGILERAGSRIIPMEFPEAEEASRDYPIVTPTEFLAAFTRERFLANRGKMDPTIADRAASALDVTADRYIRLMERRKALCRLTRAYWENIDGVASPTVKMLPVPAESFARDDLEHDYHRRVAANTRPGNILDLCATTTPINTGGSLPVGLQIMCEGFREDKALSIALAIEELLGPAPAIDVTAFIS